MDMFCVCFYGRVHIYVIYYTVLIYIYITSTIVLISNNIHTQGRQSLGTIASGSAAEDKGFWSSFGGGRRSQRTPSKTPIKTAMETSEENPFRAPYQAPQKKGKYK